MHSLHSVVLLNTIRHTQQPATNELFDGKGFEDDDYDNYVNNNNNDDDNNNNSDINNNDDNNNNKIDK